MDWEILSSWVCVIVGLASQVNALAHLAKSLSMYAPPLASFSYVSGVVKTSICSSVGGERIFGCGHAANQ